MKKLMPFLLVLMMGAGCLFSCTRPDIIPGDTTRDDPGFVEPNTDPSEPVTNGTEAETTPNTEEPSEEETTHVATEPDTEEVTEPITQPVTEPVTNPETEPQTEPENEPVTEPETTPPHVHEYAQDGVTYELSGATCEAGVVMTSCCSLCGEVKTELLYEHIPCLTERADLAEHDFCGGYVSSEACLCGEYLNYSWNLFCNYTTVTDTGTDGEGHTVDSMTYACSDCGKQLRYSYYKVNLQDSCEVMVYASFDQLTETEPVGIMTCRRNWYDHVYTYTWEEGISSCEEGVTVSHTCQYCGHSDGTETIREHRYYEMERHLLADSGFCGGYVSMWACPCGQYENYDWQLTCPYSLMETTDTDENGHELSVMTHSCEQCQRFLRYSSYVISSDTACGLTRVGNFEVLAEDAEPVSLTVRHNWDEHIYLYTWDGEITSCADGVTVHSSCVVCGKEQPDRTLTEHETLLTSYEDLRAAGFCGGYVAGLACPCGAFEDYRVSLSCPYTSETQSSANEAGQEVVSETRICNDCGHTLKYVHYEEASEGTCEIVIHASVEYSLGDEVKTITARSNRFAHDYVRSWDGEIASCKEGVTVRYACEHCDEQYDVTFFDHVPFETEIHDLAEYGLCGGYLSLTVCPCGELSDYDWGIVCPYQTQETVYTNEEGQEVSLTTFSCTECRGTLRYSYTQEKKQITGEVVTHAVFEFAVDETVTKTISCRRSRWDYGYMM